VESHHGIPASALPPPPLRVEAHSDATGPAHLVVVGQIDRAGVPAIRAQIAKMHRQFGSQDTIVDLAEVEFIDSSGLHLLLQTHQQLGEDHAALMLCAPSKTVRDVLSLTGLDRHLGVADTLAQARARLAERIAGDRAP
jgi:anti-sigma B factor antagonist